MTVKPLYRRVLLKASGEALMGEQHFGIDVSVVDRIAAGNPATVPEARSQFDRATQVEYSIQSIKSGDLVISKDGNDKVVIEFAWDKEIDVFGPVYLLIKYRGKSH